MNKPDTKLQMVFDPTYMRYLEWFKFMLTEGRMVVTKGWGEAEMGSEC